MGNNHSGFVIVSDLNHHVWHENPIKEALPVCREQGLGNKPIMPGQAVTHHRDAVPIITANIKGVTTQTSHDLYLNSLAGRSDKEPVVALKSVHNHFLYAIVGDVEPTSKDPGFIHDKIITKFSSYYDQDVKTIASLNIHRCIDRVGDRVRTISSVDIGEGRSWVVRIHPHEGPHKKTVITFFPIHEDFRHIPVDCELVFPDTPEKLSGFTQSVAQESSSRLGSLKIVFRVQPIRWVRVVPRRIKDLSQLEGIITSIPVDRDRREGIIKYEGVISISSFHNQ